MGFGFDDHWIWDSWYAREGDTHHGYFLRAPKVIGDPELRHWNVEQVHATSTDLETWEYRGVINSPAPEGAWDDYTTWTGSVIQGPDGRWHLFYTGSHRAEDGLYQRIGHKVGPSPAGPFDKVGDGMCLDLTGSVAELYETHMDHSVWHDRAMRDPWVMADPEGGWMMFFTARARGVSEPNAGGCIGFATSPDLDTWTLQPPVFTGGYGQLEVPQVFERGGHWYCLFCTAAEHFSKAEAERVPPVTGTHYLIGAGPRGPWRLPEGAFLDGALPCRRYAARMVEHEGEIYLLGFVDRPDGGDFVGRLSDPDRVIFHADGRMSLASQMQEV